MGRTVGGTVALELASTPIVTAYPFTSHFWFRTSDNTLQYNMFFIMDSSVDDNWWGVIGLTGSNIRINTISGTAENANTSTNHTEDVYNSATNIMPSATDKRIYLNGGGVGQNTNAKTPTGLDRTDFGKLHRFSGPLYATAFDVAQGAVWDVELTTDELASLAAGFAPEDIRLGSIVLLFRMFGPSLLSEVGGHIFTEDGSPAVVGNPPQLIPSYEALSA